MAEARKFLFETSFDRDSGRAVLSQAEIAAANERAALCEKGRQQGLAEARATIEQLVADAMANIAAGLEILHRDRTEIRRDASVAAIEIALALVRKLLPELTAGNAFAEIKSLIGECLAGLVAEPHAVIRVHESLLDPLRQTLDSIAQSAGFSGDLVLLADPSLGVADCRIEWADGGAEREVATLQREVDGAARRVLTQLASGTLTPPVGLDSDAFPEGVPDPAPALGDGAVRGAAEPADAADPVAATPPPTDTETVTEEATPAETTNPEPADSVTPVAPPTDTETATEAALPAETMNLDPAVAVTPADPEPETPLTDAETAMDAVTTAEVTDPEPATSVAPATDATDAEAATEEAPSAESTEPNAASTVQ